MRTISASLESAILDSNSARVLVKAVIDPSRTFFSALTYDYPYDGSDYSAVTDTPVGQCMIFSPSQNKAYTFVIDSSTGGVYVMEQGSATKHNLGLTANQSTKPSALDMGDGTAKLYYWNSGLYVSTVNLSTYGVSGTSSISVDSVPAAWAVVAGSPTVLDSTHLVLCYKTSLGGIGIGYKDGSSWYHWGQRFMSAKVKTETVWTVYTSAAILNSLLYVYSTDIDGGEVRAVEYNPTQNSWSDIFVALPADLSRFCVTNAITANGYVHIAGQFHRTDDLANAKVYSLILRSSNGKNFSWDRFTLLSNLGYQFQIGVDTSGKLLYASDRNSVGKANLSYFFTAVPLNEVTLQPPNDIISFSSRQDSGTMVVSSADETFIDSPAIIKGSRVKVYIGYSTVDFPEGEYELYGTFIIDTKQVQFKSGQRSLALNLTSEGLWKTNQIAFPFYAEMLSKTSLYDNCDEMDKMYVASCYSGTYVEYLSVDFWNNEEWDGDGSVTGVPTCWGGHPESSISSHTNYQGATDQLLTKTVTLNAHPYLMDYPVVTGTVVMSLYGWEHTEESGRPNSTLTLYAVTAPQDDPSNKTVTAGTLTSEWQKFPQPYPDTEAGSYPVTFTFSGLTVGHLLLYVGLACSNSSAGTSESYLERLEITGTKFAYSQLTAQNAWTLDKPTGQTREYLKCPKTGLQNLMFTTKPYSSLNFNVASQFLYSAGSNPLSPGNTSWGVVGLAADGFDFFIARYKRQTSNIELLIVRNGVETLLSSYTPGAEVYDIMLDHRNGLFRIWYRASTTWLGPVISHSFDEITYGPLSTSLTDIMHTGIMGAVYPPGYISAAFTPSYSDGICLTTEMHKSVLDSFPTSGDVLINDTIYHYASKTTAENASSLHYGPHQLRQVTNIGTWVENGVEYSGVGIETALYAPYNGATDAQNMLIGQSNQHTWKITESDWTVEHSTGGVIDYLRNRSRHDSDSAVNESYYGASISDKCFIGHGLLGITTVQGSASMHPQGALVSMDSSDQIWAKKVVATQVDHDATVADMLAYLSRVASIQAEFPGDWTSASVSLSGTPVRLASDKELFPGGCDIRFTLPALSSNNNFVAIYGNNLYLTDTTDKIDFGFKNVSGNLAVYIVPKTGSVPGEILVTEFSPTVAHNVRVLVHNDFVSLYIDENTAATFALGSENLEWPEQALEIYAYADSGRTITNVVISELFDWREAIYIESEMSASSAINSVIQERPIEIYPTREGNLSFSYRFERDALSYTAAQCNRILRLHNSTEQNSDNAGSDAVVYFADVAFQNNDNYATDDGFNTRVFRLSTLESGATTAARILLEKAFEKQSMHTIEMRPDVRLEIGDKPTFSYIVAGTNRNVTFTCVIESIGLSVREGQYGMTVTGRETD